MSLLSVRSDTAREDVLRAVVIGVVLTALSYGVGLAFGWVPDLNWIEVFAVFTSYASTWLCVVERRWNYAFGIVSTAAYCLLFAQFGLVSSAVLNGYLSLSLIYGFFRWRNDATARPVTHVETKWWPVYLLVTGLALAGGMGLTLLFGGQIIVTDTLILVGTILAQFLLDNKKQETWIVWVLVNIFAIYTYSQAGLALAAFQYVIFLLNAFYGYYMWGKSRRETDALAVAPGAAAVVEPQRFALKVSSAETSRPSQNEGRPERPESGVALAKPGRDVVE